MLIGFAGYNRQLTISSFKRFVSDNEDLFSSVDFHHFHARFKDGDILVVLFDDDKLRSQVRMYSQIILADDSRLMILEDRDDFVMKLLSLTEYSPVPDNYIIQIYDLDS